MNEETAVILINALDAITADPIAFNVAVNDVDVNVEDLKAALVRIYDIAQKARYGK